MVAARLAALIGLGLILTACAGGATSPGSGGAAAPSGGAGGASGPGAAPTQPERPITLRVAGSGLSGNLMTPWAAYEGGYFKKYNLDVDGVPDIAASTTAVQTLLARDIDVINITVNAAMEAGLKGAPDMVQIANPPPGAGFWLYASPEIRSVQDLRGKTVGANQVGSSTYFAVDYVFREHGMQAGRDYTILSVGNQPAQVAALQQGHVQAAVLSAPTTVTARKAGFMQLVDLNYVPFNANGPVVRREMLDDPVGRETLARYAKANVEAIARLRQDRAFADEVLQKYLKVGDPEILDEVYTAYLPKRVPLVLPEGLPPVLESIASRDPSAQGADPRRFYDNSIVEELERSGFIDALYR